MNKTRRLHKRRAWAYPSPYNLTVLVNQPGMFVAHTGWFRDRDPLLGSLQAHREAVEPWIERFGGPDIEIYDDPLPY